MSPPEFHPRTAGRSQRGAHVAIPVPTQHQQGPRTPSGSSMPSSDVPLPSIESPPVSVTPAGPGTNLATPSSTPGINRNASVDLELNGLRLSNDTDPLNMADIATAVNGITTASAVATESRQATLSPTPPAMRSRRHRRSTSRASPTRYDVADEEPPEGHRFHNPDFQRAFGDARTLAVNLRQVLGSSTLHEQSDSTMQVLHARASELATFQCPSTRTVGFVGDSGAGKSSLLNSLLHCRGLARTSNSGVACTCAITEYHHHDGNNFVVHVELFTPEDTESQIRTLLAGYRHFHLNRDSLDSTGGERQDCEDKANIARDTFVAMFRGRLQNEAMLLDEPESAVTTTLIQWAREYRPAHLGGRTTCDTSESCSDMLAKLTSEPVSSGGWPAVWPYIKKISVSLNAHILSRGLILVDLPGLRDLNTARRDITERYILSCDEVFAVCDIGRATSNPSIREVIELARQAELSKVGIVCTKSDQISADEAIRDWPRRAREIHKLLDAVESEQQEQSGKKADLAGYEDVDSEDLSDHETDERNRLRGEVIKLQDHIDLQAFKLHKFLVELRNKHVTETLKAEYRDLAPHGILQVYCVSNKDYWDHRNLSRDQVLPSVKLSCIPELRAHCIGLVADSQLRCATAYITSDIPALLTHLQLWVQSGDGTISAERRRIIRDVLTVIEARLQRELCGNSSPLHRMHRTLKSEFDRCVFERRNIDRWTHEAVVEGQTWSGWHHSSYSAFCRNYGKHCTPAIGPYNWNEKAMECMVRDMTPAWGQFRTSFSNLTQENNLQIESSIDWAVEQADENLSDSPETLSTLQESLQHHQDLLLFDADDCIMRFEASLAQLKTDAMSSLRTSFFGKGMENAYKEANAEYGSGSDRRRKGHISGQLGDERLFENLMRQWRVQLRQATVDFHTDLTAAVTNHLATISATFDLIRDDNAAQEGDQDPEFRERVAGAARDMQGQMEQIRSVISNL